MKTFLGGLLAVWFVVVFALGGSGAFVRPPGAPPIPIAIGAAGPVLVFLVAYSVWPSFRAFVLSLDIPLLTTIQAWRAGGLTFLAMYAYGLLPGAFAWPAGLGDIAIGVTAPWVVRALVHRPRFASSRVFEVWNYLGILDLVVAVSVGGLSSILGSGVTGEPTTAPDDEIAARADPGVSRAAVRHPAPGRALPGTSTGVVSGPERSAACASGLRITGLALQRTALSSSSSSDASTALKSINTAPP